MIQTETIKELEDKIQKLQNAHEELLLKRCHELSQIVRLCKAECIENELFAGALMHVKDLIAAKDLRLNLWRSNGKDLLTTKAKNLVKKPKSTKQKSSSEKSKKKKRPPKKIPYINDLDLEDENVTLLSNEAQQKSDANREKPLFAGTTDRKTVFDEDNIENILACWA